MMLPEIRLAVEGDASGVVQVKQLTWPEEAVDLERVESVLTDASHAAFAAEAEGQVVGFVDGFTTTAANGDLRWEVDLLAVHPEWRGRQLGQALITACLKAGQTRGAVFARALIQVKNRASQISFARCGFTSQPHVLTLYVASAIEEVDLSLTCPGNLVAVNTINYCGLWLEEDHSEASLRAAQAACRQAKSDILGVLVKQADLSDNGEIQALGFTRIGEYAWWTLPFEAVL